MNEEHPVDSDTLEEIPELLLSSEVVDGPPALRELVASFSLSCFTR